MKRACVMTGVSAFAASSFMSLAGCRGCGGDPGPSVERVKDALVVDSMAQIFAATEGLPSCTESSIGDRVPACLDAMATQFGSKSGFSMRAPNQATDAVAAVVLVRSRRGEWLVQPNDPGKADLGADVWLAVIAKGTGNGADALRLAVARGMTEACGSVGRAFESDADARALMKTVAERIPGACPTYASLGAGTDDAKLALAVQADHAPCVQRDLSRAGGPGGVYGAGVMRAAKGAELLWKETADRLHQGCATMTGDAKTACETNLVSIDTQTALLKVREVPTPTNGALYNNAHEDAGVDLDGGAARGLPHVDAGPMKVPVRGGK